MIFLKSYQTENGNIIAMCDEELIGRVLSSGKLTIDLVKYASFYKGDLVSEDEAKRQVGAEEIYSANVVGKRSVAVLVELGIVGRESVMMLGDVPFVHVYRMV